MKATIAVLPGDGIGPEVTAQAVKVLQAVAERFEYHFHFDYAHIGGIAIEKTGTPLPDSTLDKCLDADAVLLGAIGDPKYDNNPDSKIRPEQGLLHLRKALGLYANIRPVTAVEALQHISPLKPELIKDVDLVVYRELIGGIYFGEKGKSEDGNTAYDHCTYSIDEITRITHLAFKAALDRNQKVTLVDKANVLETSRLWRKTVTAIAADYPEVTLEYMFVDNAAMQLIQNPAQFDVILTENMFGDIISDEASVISGSLGLLPSASIGEETPLFEPIHGSYPQAAGTDTANPVASILSAAMLLEHLGLNTSAEVVREAVKESFNCGLVTRDISPESFPTTIVGDVIADIILENEPIAPKRDYIEAGASTII
jgi:3-isopropylmalate dehydrogenase